MAAIAKRYLHTTDYAHFVPAKCGDEDNILQHF